MKSKFLIISVSVVFSTVERVAACFRSLVDVGAWGHFAPHNFAKPWMQLQPWKCVMASGLANIQHNHCLLEPHKICVFHLKKQTNKKERKKLEMGRAVTTN